MTRQRQLHEDAVHIVVGIELGDEREQLLLGDRRVATQRRVAYAHFGCGLGLAGYVRYAAGVFADEYDNEVGHAAVSLGEACDALGQLRFERYGKFFTVDNHNSILCF